MTTKRFCFHAVLGTGAIVLLCGAIPSLGNDALTHKNALRNERRLLQRQAAPAIRHFLSGQSGLAAREVPVEILRRAMIADHSRELAHDHGWNLFLNKLRRHEKIPDRYWECYVRRLADTCRPRPGVIGKLLTLAIAGELSAEGERHLAALLLGPASGWNSEQHQRYVETAREEGLLIDVPASPADGDIAPPPEADPTTESPR